MTIAALYVEPDGVYANLPGVDPWPEARDARRYAGPHPVVAHPPCQRWGRFWHGSPSKPHQFKLGDDGGCFAAALAAVRRWGGVLEHPADSHAWAHFGLRRPTRGGGWSKADYGDAWTSDGAGAWMAYNGGWTCYVEQGHYGHFSRKPTWLYAYGVDLPDLNWSRLPQRLDPKMVERYGYEKARRIGVMAMIGGKDKTKIRNATPPAFRDVLLSIARTAARPDQGSSLHLDNAQPATGGSEAGGPSQHPTSPSAPATLQTAARSCVGIVDRLFALPGLRAAPDLAIVADEAALAEAIGDRPHHDAALEHVAVADTGAVTEGRPLCAQTGQRIGHELLPAEAIDHKHGAEHLGCSVALSAVADLPQAALVHQIPAAIADSGLPLVVGREFLDLPPSAETAEAAALQDANLEATLNGLGDLITLEHLRCSVAVSNNLCHEPVAVNNKKRATA